MPANQYLPFTGQVSVNSDGLKAASFAQITVYTQAGSPSLASIFSGAGGGVLANPFAADINGNFSFFASPGVYVVQVQPGGAPTSYSYYIFVGNAPTLNVTSSVGGVAAFDLSRGAVQQIAMTENITSSSVSNYVPGQEVTFIITQNSGTAYTFAWPPNVHGGMTISATHSSINVQNFRVSNNGTDLYAEDAGSTAMTGGTP